MIFGVDVDVVDVEHEGDAGVRENLAEFYGLGKGLWAGQDAQDYVNESREDRDASF